MNFQVVEGAYVDFNEIKEEFIHDYLYPGGEHRAEREEHRRRHAASRPVAAAQKAEQRPGGQQRRQRGTEPDGKRRQIPPQPHGERIFEIEHRPLPQSAQVEQRQKRERDPCAVRNFARFLQNIPLYSVFQYKNTVCNINRKGLFVKASPLAGRRCGKPSGPPCTPARTMIYYPAGSNRDGP